MGDSQQRQDSTGSAGVLLSHSAAQYKDPLEAELARATDDERDAIGTYSFRSAMEIARMELPPQKTAWGGITLAAGQVAEIIGPPGLGKTRLALWIAICQITGRPFPNEQWSGDCGPLKWLFFGTENSIYRWQTDLRKMISCLGDADLAKLDEHLILPTLEQPGDTHMLLDDPDCVAKCENAVRKFSPDIILFDPWGDLCADELKDDVQRATVAEIRKIARSGSKNDVPAIILNHSRMGARVFAGARRDGGHYGKNGKAIFSQCRNVFNLRPAYADADEETYGDVIEIIDAKHNDRRGFRPVAVLLDESTMTYSHVADFDHEAAQKDWDNAASARVGRKAKTQAEKDAEKETREKEKSERMRRKLDDGWRKMQSIVRDAVDSITFKALLKEHSGVTTNACIDEYVRCRTAEWKEKKISDTLIAETPEMVLRDDGTLAEKSRRKGGKTLKGTPVAIAGYLDRVRRGEDA